MTSAVETVNLTKRFGQVLAVDSLSLNIPDKGIFAIVGENGAGKTTFMGMLSGLVKPTFGDIKILGRSVSKTSVVRDDVGIALQNSEFEPHWRVIDVLEYYARLKGIEHSKVNSHCMDLLKRVNLESKARIKVKNLSHGMIQSLSIAQALIDDPKLIILDEPSSGLDPKYYHDLKRLLKELGKSHAILLSSHNLDFVRDIADTVAIMHKGRIVVQEKVKKLTSRSSLEKVFLEIIEAKV